MAILNVTNDRFDGLEILHANIFTPGQGICLQRLAPEKSLTFKFDHSLAYGSWYDIQIIGRNPDNSDKLLRYLKKGIYLSYRKTIKITEITDEKHRDHGAEWKCGSCNQANVGSVAICEYCYTNKSQTIIAILSCIPLLGIPFSVTNAILRCGKAAQSNNRADNINAGLATTFAVIDIITAPLIVGSLIQIPAKVAAETGVKLTGKTVFCEAGKPLLEAFVKELGTGGIVIGANMTKGVVQTAVGKVL
ncbi:unnamed protein product [Adineta steineri]|uniref:RanBP2-type domain-containing protein n=1 Tax=Adineta steineri TaxID=433720 RepID=A0A815NFF3_9BILA|nr:unnamed protein product [Adineta steineri]